MEDFNDVKIVEQCHECGEHLIMREYKYDTGRTIFKSCTSCTNRESTRMFTTTGDRTCKMSKECYVSYDDLCPSCGNLLHIDSSIDGIIAIVCHHCPSHPTNVIAEILREPEDVEPNNKPKCQIVDFKSKDIIPQDLLDNELKYIDDTDQLVIITINKKGGMDIGYTTMYYREILGLLEVAKQIVIEEMRPK